LTNDTRIIKQYEGFLKTPQLFKTSKSLNAEIFESNLSVDNSSIKDIINELSRQKYLGKRAELFLLQYLMSSERYSEISHSLQIQDNNTTIGEIDMICYDNLFQKWIHIELVYKLYVFIGQDNFDDFTQWIGPNLKDRLSYKMDKLMSRQLPLGQHQKILEKIGADQIETYCCFKAKLFLKSDEDNFISNHLNDKCLSGHYLNIEEFKVLKYDKSVFYVPEKMNWICEAKSHSVWYDYDKAISVLKPSISEKRAKLVWQKNISGEVFEYVVVWW
jgi:hypothetical protein